MWAGWFAWAGIKQRLCLSAGARKEEQLELGQGSLAVSLTGLNK